MPIDRTIKKFVENCDAKAFATFGNNRLNVIPVSTIRVFDSQIWLFDYFMKKTENNLQKNQQSSLACWKDMEGYQFKGKSEYKTSGQDYEQARKIVEELHPDRTLKGLIVFTPDEMFPVSPQSDSTRNILK